MITETAARGWNCLLDCHCFCLSQLIWENWLIACVFQFHLCISLNCWSFYVVQTLLIGRASQNNLNYFYIKDRVCSIFLKNNRLKINPAHPVVSSQPRPLLAFSCFSSVRFLGGEWVCFPQPMTARRWGWEWKTLWLDAVQSEGNCECGRCGKEKEI